MTAITKQLGWLHKPTTSGRVLFTEGLQPRFSLRSSNLARLLDSRKEYPVDSVSVNQFFGYSRYEKDEDKEEQDDRELAPARAAANISHFCAAFVRIPATKKAQSATDALIAKGFIPPPSITIKAPRQTILLWLLQSGKPLQPAVRTTNKYGSRFQYSAVQGRLSKLFSAELKASIQRCESTDIVPLPAPDVVWERNRAMRTYTMQALYETLFYRPVPHERLSRQRHPIDPTKPKNPVRQAAILTLQEKRLKIPNYLGRWRGSLKGAEREFAVKLIALSNKRLYRLNQMTEEQAKSDTYRKALKLNERFFRPPLTELAIESILEDAFKHRRAATENIPNAYIAERFAITPDESRKLVRLRISKKPMIAARFKDPGELMEEGLKVSQRDERISERRAVLMELHDKQGDWPTVREAQRLLAQRGINVAVGTIQSDYRELRNANQ